MPFKSKVIKKNIGKVESLDNNKFNSTNELKAFSPKAPQVILIFNLNMI